ncbi:MAG TPA: hypothetical protein VF026_08265 [Ktedonobacteraceae bacterium]
MNPLLATLGDPIWQVLALVITLAALVLIVAVRTHDMHTSEQQKRRDTLIILRVWFATFLLMSGGALFHGAHAASTVVPEATQPSSATASSHGGSLSSTPSPSPSPTPFPRLVPSPAQVLTTFCGAINQHDLNNESFTKLIW